MAAHPADSVEKQVEVSPETIELLCSSSSAPEDTQTICARAAVVILAGFDGQRPAPSRRSFFAGPLS